MCWGLSQSRLVVALTDMCNFAAYLVEIFPYAQRTHGISVFQFFSRVASFSTTWVNPIGLHDIKWKWLTTYCCWIAFEIVVVYFLFPETSGRTLEELAFRMFKAPLPRLLVKAGELSESEICLLTICVHSFRGREVRPKGRYSCRETYSSRGLCFRINGIGADIDRRPDEDRRGFGNPVIHVSKILIIRLV